MLLEVLLALLIRVSLAIFVVETKLVIMGSLADCAELVLIVELRLIVAVYLAVVNEVALPEGSTSACLLIKVATVALVVVDLAAPQKSAPVPHWPFLLHYRSCQFQSHNQ
jgi:hypothetical protein